MKRYFKILAFPLLVPLFFVGAVYGSTAINSVVNPPNLQNGLVGHWTFDGKDMVSNVADSSGQGENAHLEGFTSTTTIAGVAGQALKFSSSAQVARVSSHASLDNLSAFTYAVWVRPDSSTNSWGALINRNQSFTDYKLFRIYQDTTFKYIDAVILDSVGSKETYSFSATNFTYGQWMFLVLTYDDNGDRKAHIYKNGTEVSYGAQPANGGTLSDDSGATLTMGARGDGSNFPLTGALDDVRVYNRVLSAAEIKQLYNAGGGTSISATPDIPAGLNSGLVGWYTFDGKDSLNGFTDRSSQGNTAYMPAAYATTTVMGKIGQALQFSNQTRAVIPGTTANQTQTFTYVMWIYPRPDLPRDAGAEGFFGSSAGGGGVEFRLSNSGSPHTLTLLKANVASICNGGSVPNYAWSQVAVSYDSSSGQCTLYVNGAQVAQATSAQTFTLADYWVGNNGIQEFYAGYVDNVRMYNRVLSAAEIKELYNLDGGVQAAVSLTPPNLQNGLVGHWSFDGKDMVQNVADSSGQGNNGHLSGFTSTTTTIGPLGQALTFGGSATSNCVVFSNTTNLSIPSATSEKTVSAWIKTSSADGVIYALRKSTESPAYSVFDLVVGNNGANNAGTGKLSFIIRDFNNNGLASVSSASAINDGKWHLVSIVRNSSKLDQLYIDGKADNSVSDTIGSSVNSDTAGSCIGYEAINGAMPTFNGSIDDVRVWNRALSAAEIQQLYNLGI